MFDIPDSDGAGTESGCSPCCQTSVSQATKAKNTGGGSRHFIYPKEGYSFGRTCKKIVDIFSVPTPCNLTLRIFDAANIQTIFEPPNKNVLILQ